MNKLVVVGNGFDLAHGLDTKYSDFFGKLIVPKYRDFYDKICNFIPKKELFHSLETALSKFNDEKFYKKSEIEISKNKNSDRETIKNSLNLELQKSLSFAEDMPIYLREWIREINTNVEAVLPQEKIDKNSIYLNFNYTDTLERAYGISCKQILYIHGKAKRGDDLILGHNEKNKIKNNNLPMVKEKHNQLAIYNQYQCKKIQKAQTIINSYYEKTYKDSINIINNNKKFFNSLYEIKEIYIYGHSLSRIDYDYFFEIREKVSCTCNWNISFHDKKDLLNAITFVEELNINSYNLFKF